MKSIETTMELSKITIKVNYHKYKKILFPRIKSYRIGI